MNTPTYEVLSTDSVSWRFLKNKDRSESTQLLHLPQVIEAKKDNDLDLLISFCRSNPNHIQQARDLFGAVLFRGFAVRSPIHFQKALTALGINLDQHFDLEPQARTRLAAGVFESSAYKSPWVAIMPHTELVYSMRRPATAAFWCGIAPTTLGETPISDFAAVYQSMDEDIKALFDSSLIRVTYKLPIGYLKKKYPTRNHEAFDRDRFETACQMGGLRVKWKTQNEAHAEILVPGIVSHPRTGRLALNYAFFSGEMRHVFLAETWRRYPHRPFPRWLKTLWKSPLATRIILAGFDQIISPSVATTPYLEFSNGQTWSADQMRRLTHTVWDNSVFFCWRQGDILLLDNVRIAHARMPNSGPRKVAVAIGDQFDIRSAPSKS